MPLIPLLFYFLLHLEYCARVHCVELNRNQSTVLGSTEEDAQWENFVADTDFEDATEDDQAGPSHQ